MQSVIYNRLIERARNRPKLEGVYYEEHHVLPKFAGGTDVSENLVCLLAEEHYIAHQLLYRMYRNTEFKHKAFSAISMMCVSNNNGVIRNNKMYSWMRKICAENCRKQFKGKKKSLQTRKKMSESSKGKKKSLEHRLKITERMINNNPFKGHKISEEHRNRIIDSNRTRNVSDLTKWRIGNKQYARNFITSYG